MGPHGFVGGWGWGWGFGGPITHLLLLVLVIAAAVWLVRAAAGRGGARGPAPRGLEILEERYARGEIGRDEYVQKRRDIIGAG